MGVEFPVTKEFYRARFDMFGFADAPQHQADMARVLKRYLNTTVHSDGRSQCTAIFVDDGHTVHDSGLGLAEATIRTEAELQSLEDVGVRVSTHETHYPFLVKDYIGREIHSVPQHFTASVARIEKYTRAADELLGSVGAGGSVSRRGLAAVEPFVSDWDPGRQWGPDVTVQMDAAAGDGWHCLGGLEAHRFDFPEHERAPHKSFNFREASTAASAVELLGPSHRGGRLLLRTDNTTTTSLVNKQDTMAPDLWPVGQRMFWAAAQYDLDLAAEHIPGVENGLSDGLSRYVRRKDYLDWQYKRDEFESIQNLLTAPFTLDGGADPVGTNAHLPRYRSVVDSFTGRPVDGEHVYSNPDYAIIREYLEHFLSWALGMALMPSAVLGRFVGRLIAQWLWCTFPHCCLAGATVRLLREVVHHLHFELGSPCQCSRGTQHVTVCLCLVCHRLLCRVCAGVDGGLTGMWCVDCWLLSAGWDTDGRPLAQLVTGLLALRTRPATDVVHARGVRDMSFFLGHFGGTTLPATPEDVLGYAGYVVELREFRLDSSTWVTIFRYGFVVAARHGRHNRLLFVFCTVGCLRPTGTRYLRVFYRLARAGTGVSIKFYSPADVTIPHVVVVRGDGNLRPYVRGRLQRDKNVDARTPRFFYLPEHIPGLCCSPVALLEDYVLRERVPSGGLLFAAPEGASGWYPGPYMGYGRAFVRAYGRAYPTARDGHLYGDGSARKSLGQWLWTYGWASRMISDVGGWYTPKTAMDLYFTTHRTTILQALEQLGSSTLLVTVSHLR
ncbi:hypothetical protein CYMTET_10151 [Cymbomonas tetramitiformis]|uniref:Uncharacterized protein n=1 Tax=Cymbomonas tetramitiformis TaxID=36881 RepID=A0AAE0LEF6_9CHLO|nr:hypothetical protein CYMTET_10151 [Cymbomonas tetramitiformis]